MTEFITFLLGLMFGALFGVTMVVLIIIGDDSRWRG